MELSTKCKIHYINDIGGRTQKVSLIACNLGNIFFAISGFPYTFIA